MQVACLGPRGIAAQLRALRHILHWRTPVVRVREFSEMDCGAPALEDGLLAVYALTQRAVEWRPPRHDNSIDSEDAAAAAPRQAPSVPVSEIQATLNRGDKVRDAQASVAAAEGGLAAAVSTSSSGDEGGEPETSHASSASGDSSEEESSSDSSGGSSDSSSGAHSARRPCRDDCQKLRSVPRSVDCVFVFSVAFFSACHQCSERKETTWLARLVT
jgi:hypothetical protein